MRDTWKFRTETIPHSWVHDWQEKDVILEFNGPQLTIVESKGVEYLSVASDEGENSVRWLRSPISQTEKIALYLGSTTVLDCILKPEIWIVDIVSDGTISREVKVSAEELVWIDLPSFDSVLPKEITNAYASDHHIDSPSIVIDGPNIACGAASFRLLSDVFQSFQKLWSAIAQVISGNSSESGPVQRDILPRSDLLLQAVFPSSFGLSIESTDGHLFNKIAEQYKDLILSSSDPEKLKSVFARLQSRVRSAYSDYLVTIQNHSIEVLARWDDEGAFISSSTARRVEPFLAFTEGDDEEVFALHGFFRGFNLKTKKFLFVDDVSQEEYSGLVLPDILRDPNVRITISNSVRYDVKIKKLTFHAVTDRPKHKFQLEGVREKR